MHACMDALIDVMLSTYMWYAYAHNGTIRLIGVHALYV